MFWNHIWWECVYPSSGVVCVIHKKAKAKYKYAVRRLLRSQNHLRREATALNPSTLGNLCDMATAVKTNLVLLIAEVLFWLHH